MNEIIISNEKNYFKLLGSLYTDKDKINNVAVHVVWNKLEITHLIKPEFTFIVDLSGIHKITEIN